MLTFGFQILMPFVFCGLNNRNARNSPVLCVWHFPKHKLSVVLLVVAGLLTRGMSRFVTFAGR